MYFVSQIGDKPNAELDKVLAKFANVTYKGDLSQFLFLLGSLTMILWSLFCSDCHHLYLLLQKLLIH